MEDLERLMILLKNDRKKVLDYIIASFNYVETYAFN